MNEAHREILEELVRLLDAIGGYSEDIVVTGGLVPVLYRFHPDYQMPRQSALLSKDVDLTVPAQVPLRGDITLRTCLEEGGFVLKQKRTVAGDAPPKHFFQHKSHGTEKLAKTHVEFLTPLRGPPLDRDGKPKSPREVQEGLNAEALRYMDLLLSRPMKFAFDSHKDLPGSSEFAVHIPRPGAYVIQKALSSEERDRREKRHKDWAYIYDVATVTQKRWATIRNEIEALRRESDTREKWIERAAENLERAVLADETSGAERIAGIYEADDVRADTVRRVVDGFLGSIGLK